jgi:hypothetical protein
MCRLPGASFLGCAELRGELAGIGNKPDMGYGMENPAYDPFWKISLPERHLGNGRSFAWANATRGADADARQEPVDELLKSST